jgi:hypothetical protein
LSGALSPSEFALLERLVKATEIIADAANAWAHPVTVLTNMPDGSYETGYITPGGTYIQDRKPNRRGRVIMDDIP